MGSNEADIRNAALEEAAKVAEDYDETGTLSAPSAIAVRIRALKSDPAPVPESKPFVFADHVRQAEWERQRKERGE